MEGGRNPASNVGGYVLRETEKINVLNYNEHRVSVMVSPTDSYLFEASPDGDEPIVIPMTIDQIRYVNNGNAFKGGYLSFEEDKKDEIYNILGIRNRDDILSNKDIRNILVHPTFDGLKKIISIKDVAVFERVRAALHKLKFEGIHDVSTRVNQIVDTRYKELQNKQVTTSIVLEKKDIPEIKSQEVDKLREENKAMQEQMLKMQAMMEQLMKTNSLSNAMNEPVDEMENSETKKTTRAKKSTN